MTCGKIFFGKRSKKVYETVYPELKQAKKDSKGQVHVLNPMYINDQVSHLIESTISFTKNGKTWDGPQLIEEQLESLGIDISPVFSEIIDRYCQEDIHIVGIGYFDQNLVSYIYDELERKIILLANSNPLCFALTEIQRHYSNTDILLDSKENIDTILIFKHYLTDKNQDELKKFLKNNEIAHILGDCYLVVNEKNLQIIRLFLSGNSFAIIKNIRDVLINKHCLG